MIDAGCSSSSAMAGMADGAGMADLAGRGCEGAGGTKRTEAGGPIGGPNQVSVATRFAALANPWAVMNGP